MILQLKGSVTLLMTKKPMKGQYCMRYMKARIGCNIQDNQKFNISAHYKFIILYLQLVSAMTQLNNDNFPDCHSGFAHKSYLVDGHRVVAPEIASFRLLRNQDTTAENLHSLLDVKNPMKWCTWLHNQASPNSYAPALTINSAHLGTGRRFWKDKSKWVQVMSFSGYSTAEKGLLHYSNIEPAPTSQEHQPAPTSSFFSPG